MRPITLTTGQYGDIPFDELCSIMSDIGYDGLEIACHAHLDAKKYVSDESYRESINDTLKKNNLKVWALGAHLAGQCVGDNWDERLDNFAPSELHGKPEEIRAWAIEEMKQVAYAAKLMGVSVVTGFTGSPIWPYWYSFPQTDKAMVNGGFEKIKELWTPIFDVFDECGVKFALEVHPAEIAFDYYSTQKLLEVFDHRPTLGVNFDPSHLLWQGVNPCIFLRDFASRIYHVHMKDVKIRKDGKAGILGSHIDFGDLRRAWNFVSLGHGDVDFDDIIRELNAMKYTGPLSVEWEDSGMERMYGAREAFEFTKRVNYEPSNIAFDSALKSD